MHAILLNLIKRGEIRSITYADRWLDFERVQRLFVGVDWATCSPSIIRFENGASVTLRGRQ